ncbi:tektin-3-like isoform X1 [Crassostrea angulata]|uniref:Tektin n=1 Tax=Magallana gigas TaxID=29159 RepID=K1QTB9_MAGGI|nr:tektin-3-like isoform X1 [Crassostrea gigas]XP_034328064.1 tektin-3-like isoform X1 [Crassostrea gigas]XP_034328073.1 tektin-3-like isoform X1 [Crassostrea gigas]XP_034328084.1 tektin-3-like isoform X1 [Crassostrea gigas]XP_052712190.1 tektin-3-like isoform X1 [Crassostrea angulata]XP_052712198.1 tektin-3-like isoform X1 [Crassostrea angulata]XP_052712207.1 tektin-3-like isoform X1 [Crassostrea angulata]
MSRLGYNDYNIMRSRSATPLTPEMSKILPYVSDKTISRHLGYAGRSLDMGHAKAYYNPARNAVYSRYSTNDWGMSNSMNFSLSDKERSFAERLRADAWRAVKETDARTRNRQNDITKKLGERVYDITFWKSELNNEISAMATEIENLKEYRRTLEKALGDTANPLHIAEECLMHREKRQGIDLVHDDVERTLIKEVDCIKKCQAKMKKVLDKAYVQLKMNRAAQHAMEIDAKDKHHAQGLDDRMQQLRNSSSGIGYYPGIESIDNTITIPDSWVRYTQENIARSQKERAASERLRGEIDSTLRACANEMWNQFNSVNNSFNTRIRETTDARNKLQAHLQRTMQEIFDMEKNIELLRKAIQDKESPMKVAQTRLDERTRRINVELCNDPVMKSLQREVTEIRESVRILKERLKASELSLARLMKTKATLEHDIGVKDNTVKIDTSYCMGMRKGFPMDPKIGPVFQMPTC